LGREEEFVAERLRLHALPEAQFEQRLGDGRWLRIQERRLPDGGSVGVRTDITELKQREASFRLLFAGNPIPMYVFDRETLRFLEVNDAAVGHYGYARDEFLAKTIFDIRPAEDVERLKAVLAVPPSGHRQKVWRHRRADGSLIEV